MKTANAITNRSQDFNILNLCQLVHHVDDRGGSHKQIGIPQQ
jgi:hypothetical protein